MGEAAVHHPGPQLARTVAEVGSPPAVSNTGEVVEVSDELKAELPPASVGQGALLAHGRPPMMRVRSSGTSSIPKATWTIRPSVAWRWAVGTSARDTTPR